MKRVTTSLSVITLAMLAVGSSGVTTSLGAETFSQALQNGKTTINTRTFYFNRSFDKPGKPDAEALTVGGIMKYETGKVGNLKAGFAYYGSHSLFDIIDRDKGGGTSILQSNGDDIAFLGEAYLDYDTGTNQFKIGRQRLTGPIMNDHDLRMLPSTYEAAVYRNKSLPNTTLEAGYVDRYSGFVSKSNGFDPQNAKWGTGGLAYVSARTKLAGVSIRGQYIDTLDDNGTFDNYSYLDGKLPVGFGNKSYIKAQYGGTGYQKGKDSKMYGIKGGTSFGPLDFAVVYNKIEDNPYKAVEAGPMYTDWQQGYGNYEPSDAIGAQIIYHPISKASIKLGYVDVESESGDTFNDDTYKEFNLDAKYKLSKASKIRLRFSNKDQDKKSNREDRDDFRIIYYHNF
jgi:hypothetical protein